MHSTIWQSDQTLLRVIDDAWQEAARRSGPMLVCKRGCTECCQGPFPISHLDVLRLREGLRHIRHAEVLRERAAAQWARMSPRFPGSNGIFRDDEAAEEAFCTEFAELPCPALNLSSGACELYEYRPLSCRTFGPPVRIGQADLPPCDLCYRDATEEQIAGCRVDMDPEDLEGELLAQMEDEGTPQGQTIIAFALLR